MKMVKSLLLGSAAGIVAIAAAQAADLPVKAKPVQYVRICSLYGVGFYYIPGTDTCIKIGGFVRAEENYNTPGGSFSQYHAVNFDNRGYADATHVRTRGGISADARSQTGYGTLRAYVDIDPTVTDGAPGTGTDIWSNRAFIQWAGFTFGLTSSFYDFDPMAIYSNQTNVLGSSTGGTGDPVFAYTAQFGNGFSGTISAESAKMRRARIYSEYGGINSDAYASSGHYSTQWPDVVGNLRVDQGWGSAQLMGAVHQLRAGYYGAHSDSGHPGDETGWAIGGGIKLNLPMLGRGDFFIAQGSYTKGAIAYVAQGMAGIAGGNPIGYFNVQTGSGTTADPLKVAYGPAFDATYGTSGDMNLTEAYGFTAGYQHNWNPMWKSSIYGAYAAFNYNDASDLMLMQAPSAISPAYTPAAPTSGSADWSMYQIGSRTMWTPVKNLSFSLDVMYNHVNTAYDGVASSALANTTGATTYEDQSWWSGIVRVQRNFYP